jgi:ribosomal-protein-alanine N-acetyltransferase
MIYELHKSQLHVLNFAVRPDVRRRGVGTQMINKLIGKLSQQRRNRVVLEIRETNLAAQLFFRQASFRAVSVLRDYYDDTTEDAYVMQYRLRTQDTPLEPINRIARLAG